VRRVIATGAAPRLYRAWHPGQLVIDVEPGMPEGFSTAAGEGLHFVTRTRADARASAVEGGSS
jgi:uncharacterized protein (DUF779 family)